jgi:RNA polymerase sigma factor (sigma-70 family)
VEQPPSSHPRWDDQVRERLVAGDEAALGSCTMTHRRAVDWSGARRPAAAGPRWRRRRWPRPTPEETAVAGSVAKSVQAAVDDLPAVQREAIVLAYFDGQSYRQVAQTLGIPEGTAKSRLWQGLRGLAARLRAEGIEP